MKEFGFALYLMLELRDEECEPERLTFTVPTPPKPPKPVVAKPVAVPDLGPTERDPSPETIAEMCAAMRRERKK